MKVSFCITCKKRLSHIQETLPLNLAAMKDDPDVEFVLLNYESEDGLAQWVEATFQQEIASGRLVHAYHFPAPHFRMAHAKNMAHRIASGAILCNVDADNVLPHGYASWLRARFADDADITVSACRFTTTDFVMRRIVRRALKMRRPPPGLFGRIAVTRQNFYRLGGYDESFSGWGSDDADFQLHGRDRGIRPVHLPETLWGRVIEHGTEERLANLSAQDRAASQRLMDRTVLQEGRDWMRKLRSRHDVRAHTGGRIGCGMVKINFSDEIRTLEPLTRPDCPASVSDPATTCPQDRK